MLMLIATWIWPVYAIYTERHDLSALPGDLVAVGFLGVITIVICLFLSPDSVENMLDMDDAVSILATVGAAVDVLSLVVGLFVSYTGDVLTWVRTNGLRLNLIYLAVIFLIVFFNLLSKRAEKRGEQANLVGDALEENQAPAGIRRNSQVNLIAWMLFPPTLMAAMFPGFPGVCPDLKPLPYSEWTWGAQVALIGFALVVGKFLVLNGLVCRDWPRVWAVLALVGNSTAVGIGYILLRTLLLSQFPFLMGLAAIFIEGGLLIYSYLFLLYCALDLLSFGGYSAAWKERREQDAQRARSGPSREELEQQEYEKKLDGRERVLNAFLGRGFLTDKQAYMVNEMDTKEYVDSDLLRQQAIDKHNKK